ncbi:MAG: hypothetical protein JO026_03935, partial [Patescibacteria group bacterium]|nr:hypothetical protein [Patescibacteria group bacterium]
MHESEGLRPKLQQSYGHRNKRKRQAEDYREVRDAASLKTYSLGKTYTFTLVHGHVVTGKVVEYWRTAKGKKKGVKIVSPLGPQSLHYTEIDKATR